MQGQDLVFLVVWSSVEVVEDLQNEEPDESYFITCVHVLQIGLIVPITCGKLRSFGAALAKPRHRLCLSVYITVTITRPAVLPLKCFLLADT
jgi:hypothetical protein